MAKIEEIEPILRASVDSAIQHGYLIIAKDWGVGWDETRQCWAWDPNAVHVRSCCIFGSFLLMNQPSIDPRVHKGDPYDAVMEALHFDKWLLRDVMNGCDGYPLHSGHVEEVYALGSRLASIYRPLEVDILLLQYPQSQTRLRVLPSPESERDLQAVMG